MSSTGPEFDLAVVGGGPAGAAAAIVGSHLGMRVLLFEAGEFPRHKVCGEFVSAESLGVLRQMLHGVERAESVLAVAPTIDCTRLFLGYRTIEAAVSPPALSVTRYDLDALLWQALARAGVHAHSGCDVSSVEGDGPFHLLTDQGEFSAKAVIIAAGRWSRFLTDRTLPAGPKWIGVKAHFHESSSPRSTDLYFFDNGYCGVQPVGRDLINACAMVRSDRATSLQDVFALHPKLAERAASWSAAMQPVTTAPLLYREPQPVRGNIIFAGDAAGFIDPFVGDGISIALRTGAFAAACVARIKTQGHPLATEVDEYSQGYARHFAPLLAAASRVRSVLSLPGWARVAAFEMLRLPGVMPLVIRKTRRVS